MIWDVLIFDNGSTNVVVSYHQQLEHMYFGRDTWPPGVHAPGDSCIVGYL